MDTLEWKSGSLRPGLRLSSLPPGNSAFLSRDALRALWGGSSLTPGDTSLTCPGLIFPQNSECPGREGTPDPGADGCGAEEVWIPRGKRGGKAASGSLRCSWVCGGRVVSAGRWYQDNLGHVLLGLQNTPVLKYKMNYKVTVLLQEEL